MEVKMGGFGSGRRWRYDTKDTTEDRRKIDIRTLHKRGILNKNTSFSLQWPGGSRQASSIRIHISSEHLILAYRHQNSNGKWDTMQYSVKLTWTPCRFGGKRPWFICPVKKCQRRVAILYSGNFYACRHCHQLTYTCQREADYDRAARQAEKIREKLGWDSCIFEMGGDKPKGMHWKTFERLAQRQHAQIVRSLTKADMKFGSNFTGEYLFE